MQTLSGRTCVFSGGSGGDGVDAVKALCAGGMNVVLMTHQRAQAEALMEEINSSGAPGRCAMRCNDGSGPAEVDSEVYKGLAEEFGSVDVIISNTGGSGRPIPMEEATEDYLMGEIRHLVGNSFGMLKTALPYLRKSKAPRVIFMTTVEGIYGGVHESFAQSVAKGAVHSLTLNAAARLAGEGIPVNCIAKGPIPRLGGVHADEVDVTKQDLAVPLGRLGSPQDLAGAVCFLASEECSFLTGQTLSVSGGLELRP